MTNKIYNIMAYRRKKEIPPFKVINWDTNRDDLVYYDIMPYLVSCWDEDKKHTHKLWARWVNGDIDSLEISMAFERGMKPKDAIKQNISKKKRIDDTKMPQTYDEFKTFVEGYCFSMYSGRCEYEVIVTGWPVSKREVKIDAYEQLKENLDVLTTHFKKYVIGE